MRRVGTVGFFILLLGILTSPVKEVALRCRSNPWGWLEAECQLFKEAHWPWGYALLILGILLIAARLFAPDFDRERND